MGTAWMLGSNESAIWPNQSATPQNHTRLLLGPGTIRTSPSPDPRPEAWEGCQIREGPGCSLQIAATPGPSPFLDHTLPIKPTGIIRANSILGTGWEPGMWTHHGVASGPEELGVWRRDRHSDAAGRQGVRVCTEVCRLRERHCSHLPLTSQFMC